MSYLKSLGAGILTLGVYFIVVLAIWSALPIPALLLLHGRSGVFVRGSVFHLNSPLFLAFGVLFFAAGFYWEFRKLALKRR